MGRCPKVHGALAMALTIWSLMTRVERTLAALAVANGATALVAAIVFATGNYGAFRPQDSGGFQQIAGLLVAYAAVSFVCFVGAATGRRWDIVASLSAIVALGNA